LVSPYFERHLRPVWPTWFEDWLLLMGIKSARQTISWDQNCLTAGKTAF